MFVLVGLIYCGFDMVVEFFVFFWWELVGVGVGIGSFGGVWVVVCVMCCFLEWCVDEVGFGVVWDGLVLEVVFCFLVVWVVMGVEMIGEGVLVEGDEVFGFDEVVWVVV